MLEVQLNVNLFLPACSKLAYKEGGEKDVVHPLTTSCVKASIVQIVLYLLKCIRLVDRKRSNKSVAEWAGR